MLPIAIISRITDYCLARIGQLILKPGSVVPHLSSLIWLALTDEMLKNHGDHKLSQYSFFVSYIQKRNNCQMCPISVNQQSMEVPCMVISISTVTSVSTIQVSFLTLGSTLEYPDLTDAAIEIL
jgi:hypothetical protein